MREPDLPAVLAKPRWVVWDPGLGEGRKVEHHGEGSGSALALRLFQPTWELLCPKPKKPRRPRGALLIPN